MRIDRSKRLVSVLAAAGTIVGLASTAAAAQPPRLTYFRQAANELRTDSRLVVFT